MARFFYYSYILIFLSMLQVMGLEQPFIWGIWYNSYQKPYITFKEAYDRPLFLQQLDHFQKIGINRIYFLVKFPTGHVFYPSKIAPQHPELDWDPVAFLATECQNRGIEFYPYVNVFPEGEYNEITQEHDVIGPYLQKFPHHAMVSQSGKIYGWASPALEEVVSYELSILEELATQYPMSGIQLDRIRYPDTTTDYHPIAIAQYEALYGKKLDPNDYSWSLFRQELLTNFLFKARARLKKINPQLKLSAAVFPRPYAAIINELQAWPRWCRAGLLDEVVPMSYYKTADLFRIYVQHEQEVTPANVPLLLGIGAFFIQDIHEMEQQIQFALSHAVQGIVFFNGFHLLDPEKSNLIQRYARSNTNR